MAAAWSRSQGAAVPRSEEEGIEEPDGWQLPVAGRWSSPQLPAADGGPELPRPAAGAAAAAREWRRSLLTIGLCAAMAGTVAAAGLGLSGESARVQGLRASVQALEGQDELLLARLGALQSPQRVEQEAIARLGLAHPAGYVPVPVLSAGGPLPPPPAHQAVLQLPLPPGPPPGSPAQLWQSLRLWAARSGRTLSQLWRRVA